MENQEFQNEEEKKKAQEVIDELMKKMKKEKEGRFSFLLVGRTGVGKSSTVNSLLGKEVAKVNEERAETMEVTIYEGESFGMKYNVIDTPGLCDDLEEVGNDEIYITKIIENVKSFDTIWFVSFLNETRVSSDEKRAIRIVSKALNSKVWEQSILVFTFSNSVVPAENFTNKLESRTRVLRQEIAKYSSEKIAKNIPSVAIDNMKRTNPDGKEWIGELYTTVVERISDKGALPFLMATANRINQDKSKETQATTQDNNQGNYSSFNRESKINLDESQKARINKRIDADVIIGMASVGASIGLLFGPAGAAVGGVIGAAVGLFAWFKK